MTMYRLQQGDALTLLRTAPSDSIHTIITSPPYWGLRDYDVPPLIWGGAPDCAHEWSEEEPPLRRAGSTDQSGRNGRIGHGAIGENGAASRGATRGSFCEARDGAPVGGCGAWRGQLGLEPTPQLYVQHLVSIFREARRVLHPTGNLWLNLGDSYSAGKPKNTERADLMWSDAPSRQPPPGFKPKDLVGIPWRVALALQDDGWWLRSDIIWHKPNPMPESVQDRPVRAHEYLFLLAKSERYFYDVAAVRQPFADARMGRDGARAPSERDRGGRADGFTKPNGIDPSRNGGASLRDVWTLSTQPYPEAHFATFPEALPERCILSGSSQRGACATCLSPWRRRVENETAGRERVDRGGFGADYRRATHGLGEVHRKPWRENVTPRTTGWEPSCEHDAPTVPCTVLDPFAGSGTTGLAALRNGRSFVGYELSPAYLALAEKRLGTWRGQQRLEA